MVPKKKKFTNIFIEFYNERISLCTLSLRNINFAIIGVYLPYNSNNNLFEFEFSLSLIKEIFFSFSKKNFIVMGDFNCDLTRNNKFDNLLRAFISSNSLIVLNDSLFSVNLTFSISIYSSFIDHILIIKNENIMSTNCYIDYCDLNLSDIIQFFATYLSLIALIVQILLL